MKDKCIIIENEKSFVTKYGTDLMNDHPSVVYLRSKIKITPKLRQPTFETEIKNFKNELEQYIVNEIQENPMFENNHLCTIEISAKSVAYKKVSYMRMDLYIKPILPKTLIENQPLIKQLSDKIKNKTYSLLEKYNLKCHTKNK